MNTLQASAKGTSAASQSIIGEMKTPLATPVRRSGCRPLFRGHK